MPLPPTFQARLRSTRILAPSVRELVFERADGPFVFSPGQWLNLTLGRDDQGPLVRAYSIASAPDASGRFELAVTRVDGGPASNVLHELEAGAELEATGPQGFFTREANDGRPSLFVSTGTGVTPLRSMIRAALAAGAKERLALIIGVRTTADMLYADELAELAARHDNFSFAFTLSQPPADWTGPRGYVQAHVPGLLEGFGASEPHVYICGLERMVKSVRDLTRKQLGLPRERVHSERYD